MERKKLSALVALNAVKGIGPVRAPQILAAAGSAQCALSQKHLFSQSGDGWKLAREQLMKLRQLGARAIAPGMQAWPTALNALPQPPSVLMVIGSQEVLSGQRNRVCVIGARACTPYGRAQAERFGSGLATAGAVVVSGGARGIDQAAMRGALDAGGQVIAVVGSGLDRPYPPEAADIYHRIVELGGTVISEFACGTPPRRGNFPRRNRLMAALSPVIMVVQASLKSGTFTTLEHLNDLSATVCALPGPVDCAVSRGPNCLIADGAKLVQDPADVLAEFDPWTMPEPPLDQHPILQALSTGNKSIEQLANELEESVAVLLIQLSDLEIHGKLTRLPGGIYHRCAQSQKLALNT
jgi:DNA processing protein